MKVITPRHSFSLDYTPKQWVGLCNTFLLLFVTLMFGLVVFNMNSLDQRLVRVLDSSAVAIDLIATDLLQSQTSSYWRTISEDISVYSAFRREENGNGNTVLLIGSVKSRGNVDVVDLRCLIKYDGEEDDIGIGYVDYRKPSNCSHTVFLYCRAKNAAVPRKVALVSDSNSLPKQWMDVHTISHLRTEDSGRPSIAACVAPLTFSDSARGVAEFVAFYETIGVSHFYFYSQNPGQEVTDFTLRLKGLGHSISLLPWNRQDPKVPAGCPVDLFEDVQDCSLRAAGKYDYVLTAELNDFVVPMEHFGLPALVEETRRNHGNFSKLNLNYADFCEVNHSKSRYDDRIALKRMVVRGGKAATLSNTNYILRSQPVSAFESSDQFTNGFEQVGTLAKTEVLVHHHSNICGHGWNRLDQSAYKYMDLVDGSSVLETFRQARKDNANKVTFPET